MSRYVLKARSSRAGSDEGSSMDDGSESAGEEVSLLRNHHDSKLMRRTIRNHANRASVIVAGSISI